MCACTNDRPVSYCALEFQICAYSSLYTGAFRGSKDRTDLGAVERSIVTTKSITAHGVHIHTYFLHATLHQSRSDQFLQSKRPVIAGRFPVHSWVYYWNPRETRICPKRSWSSCPISGQHPELSLLPSVLLRVANGERNARFKLGYVWRLRHQHLVATLLIVA